MNADFRCMRRKERRAGAASDYPGHRAELSTQLLPISSVHAVASKLMTGTAKTLQLFSVYCWCAAQNSRTGHSRTARSRSAITTMTIRSCSGWAQKPFRSDHHLRAPRRGSQSSAGCHWRIQPICCKGWAKTGQSMKMVAYGPSKYSI